MRRRRRRRRSTRTNMKPSLRRQHALMPSNV
jgi:hypothetical protein